MQDRSRVVLTGMFCEQPPLALLVTLERAGCWVVDDDLLLGLRWFTGEVPEEGDPIENLAQAYLTQSVATASCYAPDGQRGRWLVESVRQNHAEGVIFCAPSFCDPALLEQPMLVAALEREAHSPHPVQVLRGYRTIRRHPGAGWHFLRFHPAVERSMSSHTVQESTDAERAQHGSAEADDRRALLRISGTCAVKKGKSCLHVCSRQSDRTAAIFRSAADPARDQRAAVRHAQAFRLTTLRKPRSKGTARMSAPT